MYVSLSAAQSSFSNPLPKFPGIHSPALKHPEAKRYQIIISTQERTAASLCARLHHVPSPNRLSNGDAMRPILKRMWMG